MKLRIGLIGLGDAWQTRHRPALRMLHDRFDVRAIYSTVPKLAENCAAEFQADAVDGYRALVQRCDIDAVMVLQHSWLGWLPMLAACEAGKAIYWAGDVDLDPERDADVRDLVDRSGVAFMMEFPRRFAPATLRLKELIATRLGYPRLVFCHARLQTEEPSQRTAQYRDPSHRELLELIDWCRYVVGREPVSVTSSGHIVAEYPTEETSTVRGTDYRSMGLLFPGDAASSSGAEPEENATEPAQLADTTAIGGVRPPVTAQISCGSYIRPSWKEAVGFRPPAAMQICCERGVAFIDLPSTLVWFDDAGRHLESLDTELPVGERLLSQFHRAVTSLVRNLGDLDDAYRAASILAAAERSDREGRRVSL